MYSIRFDYIFRWQSRQFWNNVFGTVRFDLEHKNQALMIDVFLVIHVDGITFCVQFCLYWVRVYVIFSLITEALYSNGPCIISTVYKKNIRFVISLFLCWTRCVLYFVLCDDFANWQINKNSSQSLSFL